MAMLLILWLVPVYTGMGKEQTLSFSISWVCGCAVLLWISTVYTFTWHLRHFAKVLTGISTLQDMDAVLEDLQKGWFSPFNEVWHLQIAIILMFCRILKDHHSKVNINAIHPEVMYDCDEHSPDYAVVQLPMFGAAQKAESEDDLATAISNEDDKELSCVLAHAAPSVIPDNSGHEVPPTRQLSMIPHLRLQTLEERMSINNESTWRDTDPLGDNTRTWAQVPLADNDCGWFEGVPMPALPDTSLMRQLFSQVKLGDDPAAITLPVSVLEPRSLLEKMSDLFVHPDLFPKISEEKDPVLRCLAIMRWWLSGYHLRPRGVKGCFNPVLGETLHSVFHIPGQEDTITYLAEQVSHHPPLSVFRALHEATGQQVIGAYYPRPTFVNLNCAASMGEGGWTLSIPAHKETWKATWPAGYVSGICAGTLEMQLVGDIRFTCAESGVRGQIVFNRSGWFDRSAQDTITAKVWREASAGGQGEKYPDYVIEGTWHKILYLYQFDATKPKDSQKFNRSVFYDPAVASVPVRMQALPSCDPKPSRIVWMEVTQAVRENNADLANKHKNVVENLQRAELRAREAQKVHYFPKYFKLQNEKGKGYKEDDVWLYLGRPEQLHAPDRKPPPPGSVHLIPRNSPRKPSLQRGESTVGRQVVGTMRPVGLQQQLETMMSM